MNNILNIQKHVVNSSPKDKIFLFYGAPGTRKTTVATGAKDTTLLLAFEIGYKFIPNIYAMNMTGWHVLKDVVRQLGTAEAKAKYETISIDTIGLAYKACVNYICNINGVQDISDIPWGGGYRQAKEEFEKVLGSITQMGYGLNMIAHADELNDEKMGYSVKVDVDKRPSNVIKGMADFILFARKEVRDGSEDSNDITVYAYSDSSNPDIEVKKRARFFPRKFEFTYENLTKALEEAIEKQDEFYGTKSESDPDFSIYQETEINFDEFKQEVVNMAQSLLDSGKQQEVIDILQKHLNVKLTQTTKGHLPKLYAVRDDFLEVQKRG